MDFEKLDKSCLYKSSEEELTIQIFSLETVISWKMLRPWKCYVSLAYKGAKSPTLSGCKDHCMKDKNCKMAQFSKPWCFLKDDQVYRMQSCMHGSIVFLKGMLGKGSFFIPTFRFIVGDLQSFILGDHYRSSLVHGCFYYR
jgi:hypothetical protein